MAVPALLAISLILFGILEAAPGDPLAEMPLTIPPEVRVQMREALGMNEAWHIRYVLWLKAVFVTEPLHALDQIFGTSFAQGRMRLLSWQTRGPVFDTIFERLPQTLTIAGTGLVLGLAFAVPMAVLSVRYPNTWLDRALNGIATLGVSVPTFVTGAVLMVVFSAVVPSDSPFWLPSVYDTTLKVRDWDSLLAQVRQMILPVSVLAFLHAAELSRYLRSALQEAMEEHYIRTARAKGLPERRVLLVHAMRNSLISVVTLLGIMLPGIFTGAVITETLFRVNGIGQQLLLSLQGNDAPMVMTITFIFAALTIFFNLLADLAYAALDPRIRDAN